MIDARSNLTLKPKEQKHNYGAPGRVGYDPFPLTIPLVLKCKDGMNMVVGRTFH